MQSTFYNEWDKNTAAWLRELVKQGHVTEGVVDERSIKDIQPDDVRQFKRCHFFAGIGGWDYALKLAGWPDDRPVWTGSCPCQPFSSAGKRQGQADDRHLWPDWFKLIRERRPECIFGEQVASAIGHGWLDGVFADLEGIGYTCGAVVLGAHSVGAPHIRQRVWWVADARQNTCSETKRFRTESEWESLQTERPDPCGGRPTRGLGITSRDGSQGQFEAGPACWAVERTCVVGGVGHAERVGRERDGHAGTHRAIEGNRPHADAIERACAWSDYILIPCGDGKTRRIEPGISPLVDGTSARVVRSGDYDVENTAEARVTRLKGYGNAIVPQVAASFIRAFMETAAPTKGEYE
jgi:DNA (cytosine-5)-methyltransferase 1